MHPAKSVIFFTTTSGAGYGLMFLTLLLEMAGAMPAGPAIVSYGVAYVLITAGLLASTFHLGHPERAWRALSQWRSSWLSREGVAAVFTYLPTGIFAVAAHSAASPAHPAVMAVGIAGMLGCAATVWCTAMIYASLKPVHAWCTALVPALYLAVGLVTGALILHFLLLIYAAPSGTLGLVLPVAVVATGALKWAYWRRTDGTASASTPETATGLGHLGRVRPLEAPHGQPNYLMQEMMFQIARAHANSLRRSVYVLLFGLPAVFSLASVTMPGTAAVVAAGLAMISAAAGAAIERWLFFADAKHTVGLYYGQAAA